MDATTTICHRYTPAEQLRVFVATADIIVTAAGLPGLITGDMIKPGCAIIDVGINRIQDPSTGKSRLVGDCDFESKLSRLVHISSCHSLFYYFLISMAFGLYSFLDKREKLSSGGYCDLTVFGVTFS